jgi:hypothetical protein
MKEKLANKITDTLQEFLNTPVDENFDQSYLGVVEDNLDPLKIGRVKVRLHGLYDDIPTHALPWATPNFPLGAGGIMGSFIVPEIGTIINVTFDGNDIYEPKYSDKCLDITNLKFEADKDEDYPNSVIFYETSNGDYCKINRKKGEYTLKTGGGVLIKYCENGDIQISNDSSEQGNMSISLNGSLLIDNRSGDTTKITNNIYTSAFGDIETKSNGGIKEECLDDIERYSNNDIISVAGNNTKIKTKNELELGSLETKIRTNEITITPAISTGDMIVDKDTGIPSPNTKGFNYSICPDILETPFLTVESCINGGPFNALLFDTFTGAPHQGRIVSTSTVSKGLESLDIEKQKTELTLKIKAKYAKLKAKDLETLARSYSTINGQAMMLISTLNSSYIDTKKANEIKAINDMYDTLEQEELNEKLSSLDGYVKSPIFGTKVDITSPEGKRFKYINIDLPAGEVIALEDITKKTIGKDVVGSGFGLVDDDTYEDIL